MSDQLVAELQRQLGEKDTTIKDLRDENAKRRKKNKDLETQVSTLTNERDAATNKAADFEAKVGKAPAEAQEKIDGLTSTVRTLTHKAVFRERAAEAGVDPKALDTLWRESGYKAEADEADPAAIDEAIGRTRESHPFLFKAADAGGLTPPPATPPGRGLGGDRGTPVGSGSFVVKESQLADPAWKQANQAAFLKASQDNTLKIIAG